MQTEGQTTDIKKESDSSEKEKERKTEVKKRKSERKEIVRKQTNDSRWTNIRQAADLGYSDRKVYTIQIPGRQA